MTDSMDIYNGRAFDQIDEEIETFYSYEDFCQPITYFLNEEPSDARCVSVESDPLSATLNPTAGRVAADGGCGDDVSDDYDVHPAVLGTGNYGIVRECLRRSTGEEYAVKTIEKSSVARRDHIRREMRLLRCVDHPGIMKMVDCYEDAEYVHVVSERYTGGELFDEIVASTTDSGCVREDRAAEIVGSLLEAVQYLHGEDIVHRDIKPENLLFESNEEGSPIRLIDFGLSRRHGLDDVDMTSKVGTPYYMSPGVLEGKYDRSCDLWAVGVVSYILLCGYPPFKGSSDCEVNDAVRRGDLVFEKEVWGNLSHASKDFVTRLLCVDSSKIASAEEALRHPWVASRNE